MIQTQRLRRIHFWRRRTSRVVAMATGIAMATALFVGMIFFAMITAGAIWAQGNGGAARTAASASGSGIIRGTVTDPSGAGVAGATVAAVSAAGELTSATTNAQGAYEIRGLAPG